MEYKDHPLSSLLPLMSQIEIRELAADIQLNGLRSPIVLLDGLILDGRNRYRACKMGNVKPEFTDYNGDGDPLAFINSVNVKRRHLTQAQKAMVGAKYETLSHGGGRKFQDAPVRLEKTRAEIAKELEISPRSICDAKRVLETAPRKQIKAIEEGKTTAKTVLKEIKANAQSAKDKLGFAIPKPIESDWQEAETFRETLNALHRIKLRIEKAIEDRELAFREITNSTVADLHNAWSNLERVLPYAVCPTCEGHNRKNCTLCKQRGWVSRFGYEHWVPKTTRALREKAVK